MTETAFPKDPPMRHLAVLLAMSLCTPLLAATTYPPRGQEGSFPASLPDTLTMVRTEYQAFPDTLPNPASGWVVDSATRLGTKRYTIGIQLQRIDGKLQRVRMTWPEIAPPDNFIDFIHVRDSLGRVIRMDQVHGTDTMSATWEWDRACPSQTTSIYSMEAWTADSTGHCATAVNKSRSSSTSPWVATSSAIVASETWLDDRLVAEYTYNTSYNKRDTATRAEYTYLPDGRLIQAAQWSKKYNVWMLINQYSAVYENDRFVSSIARTYEYGIEISNTVLLPTSTSLALQPTPSKRSAFFARRTNTGLEFRNASSETMEIILRSASGRNLGAFHVPASTSLTVPAPAGNNLLLWQTNGTSGIIAPRQAH